eukprot:1860583-Amphidinium_carterae.1
MAVVFLLPGTTRHCKRRCACSNKLENAALLSLGGILANVLQNHYYVGLAGKLTQSSNSSPRLQ